MMSPTNTITSPAPGVFDIYLYGSIGDQVNCRYIAEELAVIDSQADQINLHINSMGGSVIEGMSVIGAIRSIQTPVTAYVDGVAASMGAVIAVACDKVVMYDFSKLMVHNPSCEGNRAITAKEQKMLTACTDMLVKLLARRGHAEAVVAELMADETWFSATEALSRNLCDEILPSGRPELKSVATDELINLITNQYQQKQMKITAKQTELLGITASATDEQIMAAVETVVAANATLKTEKESAETRATTAEVKLAEVEKAKAEELTAEATTLVEAAVKEGRIDATGKESFLKMFATDHLGAKTALAAIPLRKTVATTLGGAGGKEDLCAKTWQELDKSGRLAELKANFPDVYAEKFNERFPSSAQTYGK